MTKFRKDKKGKTRPITPRQPKPPTLQDHLRYSIPSRNTIFEGAFSWSGCHLLPDYCTVIMLINTVYKSYKQKPRNMHYEDTIENMVKCDVPKFASTIIEDEIYTITKDIITYANMSGLTYQISKKTQIDENVVKDFMEGTISNLLKDTIENGTGFLVK